MDLLLPTKKEYLDISCIEKIQLTEQAFKDYLADGEEMDALTEELDNQISNALALPHNQAADKILDIATSDKYTPGIQYKQYRYYHFVKLINVLIYEKQYRGEYSISSFKSIDDINEIYQQVTMYLRRIEYDLDVRDQLELFVYLRDKELSYFHILATTEFGTIYHKSKVYKKLADYAGVRNENFWKQLILEWDRVHESK